MSQLSLFTRRKAARPPLAIERKTHIAVADLLRVGLKQGWLSTHIPLGEHRDPVTGALLKRMGTKPGWADFVLIDPEGRHYYLELKRGNNPLSDAQVKFRDDCHQRSVPWAVARSYEEAEAILKGWGAVRVRP
jgi:hypothetical protein